MKKYILMIAVILLVFSGCEGIEQKSTVRENNEINDSSKLELLVEVTGRKNIPDYASINGELLMVTIYEYESKEVGVYWYRKDKMVKKINGATFGMFSPDGKYYSYVKDGAVHVFDMKDNLVASLPLLGKRVLVSIRWSYDSKYLYVCEAEEDYFVYRFDLQKMMREMLITSSCYFYPIPIHNSDILYMLKDKLPPDIAGIDCEIVKYDIQRKTFEPVKLPDIDNLHIYDIFTVSPDEKIIMFRGRGQMYVFDQENMIIIDKIQSGYEIFAWDPESNYVLLTLTLKEVYKYIIPGLESN